MIHTPLGWRPGESYQFYLKLEVDNGTASNRWNCTKLTVTSAVCNLTKEVWYHTWIHLAQNYELLISIYDYPHPVNCGENINL